LAGISSKDIIDRWTSLEFEDEQAEIVVANKTAMMKRIKGVFVFEVILNLCDRMA